MFRKLRVQLTALCVIVTGIVLIGMASVSFYFSVRQLRTQFDAHFDSSVSSICYVVRSQPVISHAWLRETQTTDGVLIDIRSRGYTMLLPAQEDKGGLFLAALAVAEEHGIHHGLPVLNDLFPQLVRFPMETGQARYRAAVAILPADGGELLVTVLQDQTPQERQIRMLLWQYIGAVAVSVGCLLLFGWVFTGYTVRPVEESRRRQTAFVSAASHELRSPLAVVQVCAEKIQDASLEQARRYGEMIQGECARLSRLTGDLLQLAGADNQSWRMQMARTNPDVIVLNAAERFEQLAAAKGIRLQVALPEDTLPPIHCDTQRLEQALTALLDNAIRYTPTEGTIEIAAGAERGRVLLRVSDSGPGVPETQRTAIFQRFYRGDSARTGQEHFGLGLSIVAEIAKQHGATVTVGDSPLGGATFVLSLPAQR